MYEQIKHSQPLIIQDRLITKPWDLDKVKMRMIKWNDYVLGEHC